MKIRKENWNFSEKKANLLRSRDAKPRALPLMKAGQPAAERRVFLCGNF